MKIAVLLRNDLRIHDHPALSQASMDGEILPIYVLERDLGAAFQYWSYRNLEKLQASIRDIGGELYFSPSPLPETVKMLLETGAVDAVYFHKSYHPDQRIRDELFAMELVENGVTVRIFEGTMLLPPSESVKENGAPYKVFTPFYKHFRLKSIPQAVPRLRDARFVDINSTEHISPEITCLELVPDEQWTIGIDTSWEAGEEAAIERIQTFIDEDIAAYRTKRDFPAVPGTSRISPYLAVGALSIRSVYHYAQKMQPEVSEAFIRQLIWREFAYQMIYHFPETVNKPLNEKFSKFPWLNDENHYQKWISGQTGVPLIDAGMREMAATGYMHNRVRMNVASFLTKHLLVHFTKGIACFGEYLIDADIALNTFGWQWAAGSGADASPYFRIFNPYLQSEKFDSEAQYLRKWLPELSALSDKDIREPDRASKESLEMAGVIMGETYPFPIIKHSAGRARALLAYEEIRKEGNA